MIAIADGQPTNKVAAHWARKLANRKSRQYAFLDLGATSGATLEEDEQDLNKTGKMSRTTFMFPDGRTRKATKKMLLKHNLRIAACERNIMPDLHLALVSVPKLADVGYTMVLKKDGTAIYDDNITTITASNPPILKSEKIRPWIPAFLTHILRFCQEEGLYSQHTRMWRLKLNPKNPNTHSPDEQRVSPKTINIIFDLPSSRKTFLWYHTSVGFPPKETFIDAVHNRN